MAALTERRAGAAASGLGRRVRAALVLTEIALAFVLLVGGGLLMRSVYDLLRVNPGFVAANVLTAEVPLDQSHQDPAELNTYLESVASAAAAVPGVRVAALTSALPLQGWGYGVPYAIEGRAPADAAHRRPVFFKIVSPSYVDALGITLVAGRGLRESDIAGAPRVALINQTLARQEFGGTDAIGHRIAVPQIVPGKTEFGRPVPWEIVGVIADEKITGLGDTTSAGMYVPLRQSPASNLHLVLQTAVDPASLQPAVRAAVAGVNKNQALGDVQPLEDIVAQSMLGTRVSSALLALFAAIALALAAVGIYGVMSCTIVQRTHEMGIRAALGARAGSLRWLILWSGMRPALAGLAVGLLVTDPATQFMSFMVYGVGTDDPLTIGVVAGLLLAVAGVACGVPAWRLTQGDPMEALRYE
jgi:putative ABC transport system permease protein